MIALILLILGRAWEANFVAIYCDRAHFADLRALLIFVKPEGLSQRHAQKKKNTGACCIILSSCGAQCVVHALLYEIACEANNQ